MKIADVEYVAPTTLQEAIRVLADGGGDAKLIAGGQSLLPTMAYRLAQPAILVDLRHVPGLSGIRVGDDGVTIGAMTRWRDIEVHDGLACAHPLLQAAIRHVAHYQIRNRGTVGGSLAHADPAAEMPGIAVACDAVIRVEGRQGQREIDAGAFFDGPLSTVLAEDEVIVEVCLPVWSPARRWAFQEFSKRQGDFALAGVAVHFLLDADGRATDVHLGVIGAGDQPARLSSVEAFIEGQVPDGSVVQEAGRLAAAAVDPPGDLHASAAYRRALVGTLTRRCLDEALQRS